MPGGQTVAASTHHLVHDLRVGHAAAGRRYVIPRHKIKKNPSRASRTLSRTDAHQQCNQVFTIISDCSAVHQAAFPFWNLQNFLMHA